MKKLSAKKMTAASPTATAERSNEHEDFTSEIDQFEKLPMSLRSVEVFGLVAAVLTAA